MSNHLSVSIAEAGKILKRIWQHNQESRGKYKLVPFLWGAPGLGKSAIMQALAEDIGWNLTDLRLATMSILDLRGVPVKVEQDGELVTTYARPAFVPNAEKTILFLDELPSAPPVNQAGAYEICLDRRVGSHPIHEDTFIVLAGNRQEDRGVVYEMPVPLRNRLLHINVEPDLDSFISYGMRQGLDDSILAFLKLRPNLLHQMPKGADNAFPTPRSWEFLSSLLPYGPSEAELAGLVGAGTAGEFQQFLKLRNKLPDIEKLLEKGKNWTSDDISLNYAFVFSLCSHFIKRAEQAVAAERKRLAANFVDIIAEQSEEMMILSFFLIREQRSILMDVFNVPRYNKDIVEKVRSVLRP